jgi:23S rRNA (adenine2503-C2)-methyltransferase
VCISTQAGCAMGCPFCATGQAGFRRQLTAGEVVRQVVVATRRCVGAAVDRREGHELPDDAPDHVTNVVFMGMGEPLANLPRRSRRSAGCTTRTGSPVGAGITVSTVGLVPGIRKLAELGLPVTLAVSACTPPTDELRDELVPVNRSHPLAELEDADPRLPRRDQPRASPSSGA